MTAASIDARAIQRALVLQGYSISVDGDIGPKTRAAIKAAVIAKVGAVDGSELVAFEQMILHDGGLYFGKIDGLSGPATREALRLWGAKQEEPVSPLPVPALSQPRKIDMAVFFAHVRKAPFAGALTQSQVDGMTRLFDVQERYFPTLPDDHLAYCLATDYHETGAKMQPIVEIGGAAYFTRMYDIKGSRPAKARELGNVNPGDGAKFPGMGDVQSTGRTNAKKARVIIKSVLALDVDFEADPRKLLDPLYSAIIMYYGMIHGTFTGKRLADYIDGDGVEDAGEFKAARPIINGKDKAAKIAGHASNFLTAIRAGRAAA